jgi:Cytochrome c554 and c-prime
MRLTETEGSLAILGWGVAAGVVVIFTGCPAQPPINQPMKPGPSVTAAKPAASADPIAGGAKATSAADTKPLFAGWPKPTLAFVFTGQQLGYIEPCGCTGLENQKGGLARRQTFLEQLVKDRGWTVLPLDVGSQVRGFGKQQEVKFEHAVKGLRAMGYRGLTLGEGDLKLAPGSLLAAIGSPDDGKVRDFLSANVSLYDRDVQPRYLVIEAGGKKIGVTAVLGETYERQIRGDDIVHVPPLEGLKSACRELKEKGCDFYVLLAHAPLDEARKLAEEVPIFDLVVAAGETSLPSRELETIAGTKTRLFQVGMKAMDAGVVGVFDDSNMRLRYESVPLDARFADSPAMLKLLADYQEQLQQLGLDGLEIKPRPHASGSKFVGSQKCGECHTKAFAKWSQTTHSHATDSLMKPPNSRAHIARHFDPECLSCHVTGWEPQRYFPYESGYLSLERTPLLAHNGCENCHGPGSAHVAAELGEGSLTADAVAKLRSGMKKPLAGGDAERKCLECHDDDNSPEFHKPGAFEKYWAEIAHPGKD